MYNRRFPFHHTPASGKRLDFIRIMIAIIAEKPSVAQEFAKALKYQMSRRDGYLESEEAIVTWCVGHLVALAPPNVYDAKYVKWSIFIIRRKTVLVNALNPYPAIREKGSSVWAKCSFYRHIPVPGKKPGGIDNLSQLPGVLFSAFSTAAKDSGSNLIHES